MSTRKAFQLSDTDAHHAFLAVGEPEPLATAVERLARAGTPPPVLERHDADSLGVDEVRLLTGLWQRVLAEDERRFVLVTARTLTESAQNALLKALEEPARGVTLFFCVGNGAALFPTFRSRFMEVYVSVDRATGGDTDFDPAAFLAAPAAKRLELVKRFTGGEDHEARERDKAAGLRFLGALETLLRGRLPAAAPALDAVLRTRSYLLDPSCHAGLLLQHLALELPQSKA